MNKEEVQLLGFEIVAYAGDARSKLVEALKAAENGDFSVMNNLLKALSNPFEHSEFQKEYAKLPSTPQCNYRTYCGT